MYKECELLSLIENHWFREPKNGQKEQLPMLIHE